jgi:hypothetical protein
MVPPLRMLARVGYRITLAPVVECRTVKKTARVREFRASSDQTTSEGFHDPVHAKVNRHDERMVLI